MLVQYLFNSSRDTKFSKAKTSEFRIGTIQRSLYKVKNFNTILVTIFSIDLVIRVVRGYSLQSLY